MTPTEMTPAQRNAVLTQEENVLCLAGPGSGKSSTLVARVENLLERGFNASQFIVITFTNAAARELENRLKAAGVKGLGYCGTLHGFALRMLRAHGARLGYGDRLSVISPESAKDLLLAKASTLNCHSSEKELMALKAKGRPDRGSDVAQIVVASYFDDLIEAGALDFDMLLTEFARLLADQDLRTPLKHFTHLFVDEVQDSSRDDWTIYRRLPCNWKFFVGDPDQAIFGFRGGCVQETLHFAMRDETEVIHLDANFRSDAEICEAANRLIAHNKLRIPKRTISFRGPGGTVDANSFAPNSVQLANEGEEVGRVVRQIGLMLNGSPLCEPMLPRPSIAILTRTNAMGAPFVRALEAAKLPVITREKSDLPPDWGYARALVEFCGNPENDLAAYFFLIAREEAKGEGRTAARILAKAAQTRGAREGKSINSLFLHFDSNLTAAAVLGILSLQKVTMEARMLVAQLTVDVAPEAPALELAGAMAGFREYVKEPSGDGVHVITCHAAKGREFDVVFLVGMEEGTFPPARSNTDMEEERRLAFVAMTRARKFLFISHAQSRVMPWKQAVSCEPSRFIREALR